MPEAKTKEHEDIQFSRARLTDDDAHVADMEREKLNKAMPEEFRKDPSKLAGWPPPEDRLPAVMPADKEADHKYKEATYKDVDDDLRNLERTQGTGTVARQEVQRIIRENSKQDMNEVQAPPSPPAVAAAEGKGATTNPVRVVDQDDNNNDNDDE